MIDDSVSIRACLAFHGAICSDRNCGFEECPLNNKYKGVQKK